MFFELGGITYCIKFYRTGKTTIAELFEVKVGGSELENPMISLGVYGIATPFHTDRFEKKVGRKVALEHLLEVLSDHVDEETGELILSEGPITLNREDRTTIWAKYFETHRK